MTEPMPEALRDAIDKLRIPWPEDQEPLRSVLMRLKKSEEKRWRGRGAIGNAFAARQRGADSRFPTAGLRLDEGKAASSGPARPSVSPFCLSTGRLRSNSVAAPFGERNITSCFRTVRNAENVGLILGGYRSKPPNRIIRRISA